MRDSAICLFRFVGLVVAAMLAMAHPGCSEQSEKSRDGVKQADKGASVHASLPLPDYPRAAPLILRDLRLISEPARSLTPAELEHRIAQLQGSVWPSPAVRVLSDLYADLVMKIRAFIRDESRSEEIVDAAFEGLFWAVVTGRNARGTIASVAGSAFNRIDKQMMYADFVFQMIRDIRIRFASLAVERAGANSIGPFGVQFYESSSLFSGKSDTIVLANYSKSTLNHVTVIVIQAGRDGLESTHAHYIQRWEPGEIRVAEYSSGVAREYFRETVSQVSRVSVNVYSDEGRMVGLQTVRPASGWPTP